MAFVALKYLRTDVNRAGKILTATDSYSHEEQAWARDVLANWRGCHGYPINTFRATLQQRLQSVDAHAIIAQRLKREPSIILKLQRFDTMMLSQMQDIGGLRAVVSSIDKVRALEEKYRASTFKHILVSSKDYIAHPKTDGYRSLHLVYRYKNERAPDSYNDLRLELQLRTRLQHAWATAVETMGTFLGQALKSGHGETQWKSFFKTASAALTIQENTEAVPGFEAKTTEEIFNEVSEEARRLRIIEKLNGFAVAADKITKTPGQGAYHLVILNSHERSVTIRPYPIASLEEANIDYAKIEERTKSGEPIEAVLVSAGPIDMLKKAYPNYFLDTQEFVRQIEIIIAVADGTSQNAA